mgnify:CR=1 FL=1
MCYTRDEDYFPFLIKILIFIADNGAFIFEDELNIEVSKILI